MTFDELPLRMLPTEALSVRGVAADDGPAMLALTEIHEAERLIGPAESLEMTVRPELNVSVPAGSRKPDVLSVRLLMLRLTLSE